MKHYIFRQEQIKDETALLLVAGPYNTIEEAELLVDLLMKDGKLYLIVDGTNMDLPERKEA